MESHSWDAIIDQENIGKYFDQTRVSTCNYHTRVLKKRTETVYGFCDLQPARMVAIACNILRLSIYKTVGSYRRTMQ